MLSNDSPQNGNQPQRRGLLDERLLRLAVRVISVCHALPRTEVGKHVGDQLMRSGTSAGANYREACGYESRADFVHKMQIVLKELRETDYWLRLAIEAHLVPEKRLGDLLQECHELTAMTVRSLTTAKGRGK